SFPCCKPLPVDKTGTTTTEETPGDAPLAPKPTETDKRRPHKHDRQKHEDETEKKEERKQHRRLAEGQLETAGTPREKKLVQSSVPGDAESPAGDRAAWSQSSTEGISAPSSQSQTPQRSSNKDVESETVRVDDHISLLDNLCGPRDSPSGRLWGQLVPLTETCVRFSPPQPGVSSSWPTGQLALGPTSRTVVAFSEVK
uniref:Uncharacterized protein n=1 Tax=Tetraodon nigroviridis TaxID=99883 RepID=H3BX81_TETNG